MEKLRSKGEFVVSFCRNYPIIVKGSYAQRKPDGSGVENDVLNEGKRGGVDNLSKGGRVGNAFFWSDLIWMQAPASRCSHPFEAMLTRFCLLQF